MAYTARECESGGGLMRQDEFLGLGAWVEEGIEGSAGAVALVSRG
jgi:hypothetical protein